MRRFEEHEELINVISKTIDSLKFVGKEDRLAATESVKLSIFLDISRSLAVIADAFQAEKEAE